MMRSLLISVVLVLFFAPSPVAAQAEYPSDRGSFVLGGSISWTNAGGELYENANEDRYNAVLLNPRALYFVAPGLALGGDLYVQSASQGDFESTTIAVGPAAAYFFGGAESTVYPFLAASVGYASMSSSGADGSGMTFGGSAGAAFMLSQAVALTLSGNYRIENISIDQADQSFSGNVFGLQIGVEAFLY